MASPSVDRRLGLVGNTTFKAPVTVVATTNITLSGEKTIDGVAVLAVNAAGIPDRVLCVGQTNAVDNGIWDVSTGAWSRAVDCNGAHDLVKGSTVLVTGGSSNGGTYWRLSSNNPITIGTTSLTWQAALTTSMDTLSFLQAGSGAVSRSAQSKMREMVSVKDFGAVGDGVTDDTDAIQAAIAAGDHIFFPAGTYVITETLNIKKVVTLSGESGSGAAVDYPSFLSFANNIVGIFLHRGDTFADATGHTPTITAYAGGADGSIIEKLAIVRGMGGNTTIDGISHGIWMKCRAHIRDCVVAGFAGNGIHIVAAATDPDAMFRGNANLFNLARVSCTNNNHGIYIDGADANAGNCENVDASSNQGWGIYDSSFLGNHYTQPHAASNTLGPYYVDNANAHSHFANPYTESGQPPMEINGRSTVTNGLISTNHSHAGYQNLQASNSFVGVDYNGTKIARCTVTAGGAGYTTATVTIAAPTQTQATATATLNGGRVTKATITNAGGGYSSVPTVTVTGDGSGATAVAHLDVAGTLVGITINNMGSGYTTAGFTIGAPAAGSTATAVAVLSGGAVSEIVLTGLGDNYQSAPTVTITGDGAGATATASRTATNDFVKTSLSFGSEFNNTNGDLIFSWSTNAPTGASAYRFSMHRSTMDMAISYGAGSTGTSLLRFTGARTRETFGRAVTVPHAPFWTSGIWLGSVSGGAARNVNVASTIPPTSGEFARGDVVFATSPTAGASPGVVCTTGGLAGSTAVFKAMANLAP